MAEAVKIFPFLGTLPSQVLRDEISIKLDQLFDNLKKLTLEKKDPRKAAKTTSADLFSSLRPTLRVGTNWKTLILLFWKCETTSIVNFF